MEDNIFEWHFTIKGQKDTPYEGGLYHGKVILIIRLLYLKTTLFRLQIFIF